MTKENMLKDMQRPGIDKCESRTFDSTSAPFVAILPMTNNTLSTEGPNVVRHAAATVLAKKGFSVVSIDECDSALESKMGITLGGQLTLTTAQTLGSMLCVDGLLYGTLIDYSTTSVGIYRINRVRGTFSYVDGRTGVRKWEKGLGIRGEYYMQDAGGGSAMTVISAAAFLLGVGNKLTDIGDDGPPWIDHHYLSPYSSDRGRNIAGLVTPLLDAEALLLAEEIFADLPAPQHVSK